MKLWGALLVLLSGVLTGCSFAAAVRRSLRAAEEAERMLSSLRALVCLRRLPLPEAAACLHEDDPRWFPCREEIAGALEGRSFGEVWAEWIREMGLPPGLERLLLPLGRELSAGEEPERCFLRILEELRLYREDSLQRYGEARRLCPALGLCAGGLLAVLLL